MKKNQVKVGVILFKEDVDWFHKNYPASSLSSYLRVLLHNFKEVHKDTPVDLINLAISRKSASRRK